MTTEIEDVKYDIFWGFGSRSIHLYIPRDDIHRPQCSIFAFIGPAYRKFGRDYRCCVFRGM